MRVPIRKTLNGNEYWCNDEKRTIFVPTGVEPDFEVTENPKSMLLDSAEPEQEDIMKELEDMTIPELKKYAKENNIDIPVDVKKKDDIVKLLYDNWNPDAE